MISQGVDGVSQGELSKGALKGQHVTNFVYPNLSAIERFSDLEA